MSKKYFKNLLVLGLFTLGLASCSEETETPKPQISKNNYSILVEVGTYPDKVFYMKGLEYLNDNVITTEGTKELTNLGLSYSYKNKLYQSSFGAPATLIKYEFDENGLPIEKGKIADPTSNAFAKVVFINENEAYSYNVGRGSYRLIKFNPSKMEIIGDVNLEQIKNDDAKFIMLQGMVYKDGQLYLGIQYARKSSMYPPAFNNISVAIIDLETMAVSKIITDNRTNNLLGAGRSFNIDSSGDLYIVGQGTNSVPNGIVRIKKGESEFDKQYFVNLTEQVGFCKDIMFYEQGKMLLMKLENFNDFWELKGPSYKYCKLDYINKKYLGNLEGVPVSYEGFSFLKKDTKQNRYILNSVQKEESTLYEFDPSTEKVSKITKVDGKLKSFHIYQ